MDPPNAKASKRRRRERRRRLPPWKRRRRKMLILVGLPLAILIAFGTWRVRLARKVDAQLDAIRQSGYPVTAEELSAWYPPVPKDENAAIVYGEAFRAFKMIGPKKMEDIPLLGFLDPSLDEAYSESTMAHMAEFLEVNAETLALLGEAAAFSRCRYPIDFARDDWWRSSHLKAIETVTYLQCIRAFLAAEENRGDDVVDALCDALAATHSLKNEPTTNAQNWRFRCHATIIETLMRVLSRCTLTQSQASRLSQSLGAEEDPEVASRAWAGERCYWIATLTVEALGNPGSKAIVHGTEVIGIMDLRLNAYLDIAQEVMAALKLPRPDGIRAYKRLQNRAASWMPGVGYVIHTFAWDEALLRLGRAALAVEQYRQALGALPEGLDDLVPAFLEAVPEDPYDGQSLRYRTEDHGYLVYSIGYNGKDDGGKDRADQVFRVRR